MLSKKTAAFATMVYLVPIKTRLINSLSLQEFKERYRSRLSSKMFFMFSAKKLRSIHLSLRQSDELLLKYLFLYPL